MGADPVIFSVGLGTPLALQLTALQAATLAVSGQLHQTLSTYTQAVLKQASPARLTVVAPEAAAAPLPQDGKQHLVQAIARNLLAEPRVAALVAAYPRALGAFMEQADFPKEPRVWLITRDPFGLFCYIFGWITVLLVNYVTQVKLLWPWFHGSAVGLLHGALFQASCIFILWAYLRAATTDPGTVTRKTASKGDELPPADDK